MSSPAPQTALVLSGGGAYGAFAVGIMKTLFAGASSVTGYTPLEVNIYAGTSVGAFNAACMVGYPEPDSLDAAMRLERIWLDRIAERPGQCGNGVFRIRGNPLDYLDPGCLRQPAVMAGRLAQDTLAAGRYVVARTANFLAASSSLLERTTSTLNFGLLVDSDPYLDLVSDAFREEDVRNSDKRITLVATNWSAGVPEFFRNADFTGGRGHRGILASAALPGIFPPVTIGAHTYVDGGVLDNTPLAPAFRDGASVLHVVYLNPRPELIPLRGEASSVDTLLRVYYLMQSSKLSEDIATARWINDGLRALKQFDAEGSVTSSSALAFAKVAARLLERSYRLATVHRYFPKSPLGGDYGMLDFGLGNIARLIKEGEDVALAHDCNESDCLLGD